MTKDRRHGNGVTVVSVGMVEVRSNPHSQGGPRCLGVLGKLANLARGWASGTTGGAPRSQSCVGYIRHVLGKRLLRASHAQMYKCKGSETWYMLPWLHASARAYAHMSCVWDLGSALLRPRLLCGVAYGCCPRSGDIVEAACGRSSILEDTQSLSGSGYEQWKQRFR